MEKACKSVLEKSQHRDLNKRASQLLDIFDALKEADQALAESDAASERIRLRQAFLIQNEQDKKQKVESTGDEKPATRDSYKSETLEKLQSLVERLDQLREKRTEPQEAENIPQSQTVAQQDMEELYGRVLAYKQTLEDTP